MVLSMPGANFIHVACFAVGAIVGGGVATAVSIRKPQTIAPPPPPVIDLDRKGDANFSTALTTVPPVSAVLKYGHPGGCPRRVSETRPLGIDGSCRTGPGFTRAQGVYSCVR